MKSTDPDLLTPAGVAALLGIGINAVYDGAKRGDIPHRKVGAKYLFSRRRLDAWLHGDSGGTTSSRGSHGTGMEEQHAPVPDQG